MASHKAAEPQVATSCQPLRFALQPWSTLLMQRKSVAAQVGGVQTPLEHRAALAQAMPLFCQPV